ncbi:putative rhamnogalacturonase [Wilcoxina mikolae CBS 423.85]|nr:putative rhamnogalacturonase [Wilcoxina mikolae CBS 423.85]
MRTSLILTVISSLAGSGLAAFGFTSSGGQYVVDTDGGLVFAVSSLSGDIVSLKYGGQECQDRSRFSQIGSGLKSSNVVATAVGSDIVQITVTTPTLTQYYIAKSGILAVFMGTYITAEPTISELRYITRLNKAALLNGIPASDVDGGSAVEGSDVFMVNGETRSKFYSSVKFIDDQVHCVTGSGVAACMAIGNFESSSGGPFFRDIDNQGTAQQELYFYMNSNHLQTEAYRMGFHGPYALIFTDGEILSLPDFSFYEALSLIGFVPASGRGTVVGTASGVANGVVHWCNSDAQYWVRISESGGFSSPLMKPGTYTMVLYNTELKVASTTITVTAGASVSNDISPTESLPSNLIFRIGACDGTPSGFKNADLQPHMHPSDTRMESWTPTTFVVGTNSDADFPMAQIQSVNDPTIIVVMLTAAQAAGQHTLKVYTTLSFNSGRPLVQVNSYTAPTPLTPKTINSRGFTRGAYRGQGDIYTFAIPSGTLSEGDNTIKIKVASGAVGGANQFLSALFIYDAIELF